jgi:hypothetical protein
LELTANRLSWRLDQLAKATGLSVPFLRKEARYGRLKTRKIGAAVIVLDRDVKEFLTGETENAEEASMTAEAA